MEIIDRIEMLYSVDCTPQNACSVQREVQKIGVCMESMVTMAAVISNWDRLPLHSARMSSTLQTQIYLKETSIPPYLQTIADYKKNTIIQGGPRPTDPDLGLQTRLIVALGFFSLLFFSSFLPSRFFSSLFPLVFFLFFSSSSFLFLLFGITY